MNRRKFLGFSAIGACFGMLQGCTSFRGSDHKVFLNYTQGELDDAYNQDVWAHPGFEKTIKSYGEISELVKKQFKFITLQYGNKKSEVMDVFTVDTERPAPIHVFIHGGAWRSLSKDSSAGPAPVFVDRGGIYIALNFDNIPDTTLSGMIEQCRMALSWIYNNAETFGGDRDQITLSGHSSGAHLVGVMLTTDWSRYGAPKELVKGAVVISGMCDLTAPMLSFRGKYLNLTAAQAYAYSPINFVSEITCPVFVAWGEHESPEFKRQSLAFAQALKTSGVLQGQLQFRGLDHLQAALELNDPRSRVSEVTLSQMGLHS
ncbi:alpha/beta hydrolase [Pseudomonas sp. Je.1.5.c]|uniref:alpha/beta hydrolase n=1 Tax=Pseudomonas sp. Je.1.5.c TaxID=3142839 RepID=UPI003DA84345